MVAYVHQLYVVICPHHFVFLAVAVPPSDSPRVWEIGVIFGNGFGNRTVSCSTAQADVT